MVAAFVLVAAYLLVPRIVSLLNGVQQTQTATEKSATTNNTAVEEAEFDPYAPIVIVPNDYQE